MHDCSISIANELKILQSCNKLIGQFLNTEIAGVIEILTRKNQGPAYLTRSTAWALAGAKALTELFWNIATTAPNGWKCLSHFTCDYLHIVYCGCIWFLGQ